MKHITHVGSIAGRMLLSLLLLAGGATAADARVQKQTSLEAQNLSWNQRTTEAAYGSLLLSKRARLRVENEKLPEALAKLGRSAGVPLIFSPSMLTSSRVTCDCGSQSVREALDLLLTGTGFGYVEVDQQILIERTAAGRIADLIPALDARLRLAERAAPTSMAADASRFRRAGDDSRLRTVRQGTVSGTVRNAQTGEPLAGVQVVVDGTTMGTLTNATGAFSLTDVPAGTQTIIARMIGYGEASEQVQVLTGQLVTVDFLLTQAAIALDAVVAVGYGEQTAANITGSVSRANVEDVERAVTPTVGQALQGQAPGVFIKNLNAQPGENKIDINIRGFGEPLFLIDGHEVEPHVFQELDPSSIEDVVVLKDAAAAAVYGARAGNGVVLVTTKRGSLTGGPQFTYSNDFAAQFMTFTPPMAESWEYMQFRNIFREANGQTLEFSQEDIDLHRQHRDGSNEAYPNSNQFDIIIRDYAPMQQHNLNVTGGNETVRYYVSGSLLNQRGILQSDQIELDRYNLRSNVDVSLTDNLELALDLAVVSRDYTGPFYQLQGGGPAPFDADEMYFRMWRWLPHHPDGGGSTFPNGLLRESLGGSTANAWNYMWKEYGGHRDWTDQTGTARVSLGYQLPYGFDTRATYSFQRNFYDWEMFKRKMETYNYDPETDAYNLARVPGVMTILRERRDRENSGTISYQVGNTSVFGNHQLNGLLLFEQVFSNFERVEAWRMDYPVDIPQLFAGPDQDKDNLGYAQESGRQGLVGRLNYAYDGRYSLEFNFRYDGSSSFPENSRWGFFPSVGAAWNISEESFIQDNPALSFINTLRLRGSYGRLGYDRAGDWQHLATYVFDPGSRYIYGPDGLQVAVVPSQLPNPNITWEKMDLANFGIAFDLWSGKLGGEFDIFQRDRRDVLGQRLTSVPDVVGADLPAENYQHFRNFGWDASLSHANRVGQVGYRLGLMVSKNQERTIYTDTREYVNAEDRRRNDPIGQYTGNVWRMPTDGLFKTQEEIDNWADIDGRNNATIQPGDLRYIDRNGDGRISLEDAYVVGNDATPRFTYGISGGVNWRGVELYMLWQGASVFGHDLRNTAEYINAGGNTNIGRFYVEDSFVPEGSQWREANTDAKWPCVCTFGPGANGSTTFNGIGGGQIGRPDFWFAEGDYLRLRNVQLALQLPTSLTERVNVDRARVVLGGYNVLTFYDLDFIDAEYDTGNTVRDRYSVVADGGGGAYPANHHPSMGSWNIGFELNF